MEGTQTTARTMAHSGVEGGRSHDGDLADNTRGTTDGDEADGAGGEPGGADEPKQHRRLWRLRWRRSEKGQGPAHGIGGVTLLIADWSNFSFSIISSAETSHSSDIICLRLNLV